jgi:hypothetical protein
MVYHYPYQKMFPVFSLSHNLAQIVNTQSENTKEGLCTVDLMFDWF